MKKQYRYPYFLEEIFFVLTYLLVIAFVIIVNLEFAFQGWESATTILLSSMIVILCTTLSFKKEVFNYWCHISISDSEIASYRFNKQLCVIDESKRVYYAEMCWNQYRGQTKIIIVSNEPIFDNKRIVVKKDFRKKQFRYSAYYSPTTQIILQKKHISEKETWIREGLPYSDMDF